jgi:hypothetical protein
VGTTLAGLDERDPGGAASAGAVDGPVPAGPGAVVVDGVGADVDKVAAAGGGGIGLETGGADPWFTGDAGRSGGANIRIKSDRPTKPAAIAPRP